MSNKFNVFKVPTQTSDCKNYFSIRPLAVTCVILCGLNFLCASKKATKENFSAADSMYCNNGKFVNGFTLVELIVTLAIAALLTTLAVPSFTSMVQNNRLTTQTNQFVTAMHLARNEAIKRKQFIDVIALDSSNSNDEWGPGWRIDDKDGVTLRTFPALEGNTTLDSTTDAIAFRYTANGRANLSDTLTLCDNRSGEKGRLVTLTKTGRISTSTITCP